MTLPEVQAEIESAGLAWRGVFHPSAGDLLGSGQIRTVVLIGFTGRNNWRAFASSPEFTDCTAHPLDRWSRRIITALATTFGTTPMFPFDGPPWLPFQRWAQKAEPVYPSPLGMLIHPDWGLWHAWRGALGFHQKLDLPEADRRASPCESCVDKPCLTACPATAFVAGGMTRVHALSTSTR